MIVAVLLCGDDQTGDVPKHAEFARDIAYDRKPSPVDTRAGEIGFEKYSPVDELLSKLHALNNRQRISKKENKKRGKKKFELEKLKKELSELESDIEDSVKLRDSTKKEIKLLEKEIAPLWDSIAHLIPYSSALEKA